MPDDDKNKKQEPTYGITKVGYPGSSVELYAITNIEPDLIKRVHEANLERIDAYKKFPPGKKLDEALETIHQEMQKSLASKTNTSTAKDVVKTFAKGLVGITADIGFGVATGAPTTLFSDLMTDGTDSRKRYRPSDEMFKDALQNRHHWRPVGHVENFNLDTPLPDWMKDKGWVKKDNEYFRSKDDTTPVCSIKKDPDVPGRSHLIIQSDDPENIIDVAKMLKGRNTKLVINASADDVKATMLYLAAQENGVTVNNFKPSPEALEKAQKLLQPHLEKSQNIARKAESNEPSHTPPERSQSPGSAPRAWTFGELIERTKRPGAKATVFKVTQVNGDKMKVQSVSNPNGLNYTIDLSKGQYGVFRKAHESGKLQTGGAFSINQGKMSLGDLRQNHSNAKTNGLEQPARPKL